MLLLYDDCICRTSLAANITFYTLLLVNLMNFIGFKGNGIRRALLGTYGASDTFLRYYILDELSAFSSRTPAMQMRHIFIPEIEKRG
jgi:hypothetical protein